MMSTVGGGGIWVGHVDTWTAWVNDANAAVIKASDFVGMDVSAGLRIHARLIPQGYPYFQGSTIASAKSVFLQSISATKAAIQKYKPGTPLWITETGWPVAGPNYGAAVPSKATAQPYWQQVVCPIFPQYASYYYTLRDYNAAPAGPSFGVVDINFAPLFNLGC